ncbi:hypothetical protein J4Q44_G00090160 [Coregonus suidteri]|uniref:Retinoblastoma-associated protein A-box domain-containing protein n=1 Tax=Coregonus suidteri TaxID=861788 RepID=A0AAN8QYL5_9TELE
MQSVGRLHSLLTGLKHSPSGRLTDLLRACARDPSILEQDVFQRSLLACCLEIVIFSYRPPGDFPRVIHIFQLPAYHFYKVEEQVLESLAWRGGSPLWDSIQGAKNQPPACQEVMPPQHLRMGTEAAVLAAPLSPLTTMALT